MSRGFGQYARITIRTSGGQVLLRSDDLRVDFDIRHIAGFSRGAFTVYNLAPSTVKAVLAGGVYVGLEVALHDGPTVTLADGMYASNVVDVIDVPNTRLTLYCIDTLRKTVLDKRVDVRVKNPTLRTMLSSVNRAAGYTEEPEFENFPDGYLDMKAPARVVHASGSVQSINKRLSKQNSFIQYAVNGKLKYVYQPNHKNVNSTLQGAGSGRVLLDTRDMRSNPKLGPSTCLIDSNLDPRISPGKVLDISNLLTADTSLDFDALAVATNILRQTVSGNTRYQGIQVQHKGSNFTDKWNTVVQATRPTPGSFLGADSWFK